jgi:ribosomal protein S18 acetylase RimI-like enzyme
MPDMLVKLYRLREVGPILARLKEIGIEVRRAFPAEKPVITDWVRRQFGSNWAAECEAALGNRPVSCFIAVEKHPRQTPPASPHDLPAEVLLGFACYEATRKGMFGPHGVGEAYRGRGIGQALLLACLHAMAMEGYAYAVIGWAGPIEFYAKTVGAMVIEGSEPGPYRGPLVEEP